MISAKLKRIEEETEETSLLDLLCEFASKTKKMKFNKIYVANENLKTFLLPFNRPTSRAHIQNIAKSMRKHGWMGVITMVWTNIYGTKRKIVNNAITPKLSIILSIIIINICKKFIFLFF